ncbi:hypothetical protein Baya_7132 [Bagarius yarrelli]|uniref:Uncharacterized protein n=1 Tax=Bagarius yarrelli TaxID=175774 RepID=A0A556TZC8_BAGYA|nr:hypothetical protein Baya_7132 [Bagarius yarrelli]
MQRTGGPGEPHSGERVQCNRGIAVVQLAPHLHLTHRWRRDSKTWTFSFQIYATINVEEVQQAATAAMTDVAVQLEETKHKSKKGPKRQQGVEPSPSAAHLESCALANGLNEQKLPTGEVYEDCAGLLRGLEKPLSQV